MDKHEEAFRRLLNGRVRSDEELFAAMNPTVIGDMLPPAEVVTPPRDRLEEWKSRERQRWAKENPFMASVMKALSIALDAAMAAWFLGSMGYGLYLAYGLIR